MTNNRTPDMLVVLDSDPNSLAPLAIAQRYANGTVLLTSWDADPLEIEAAVQDTASSEPTISEALEAAAQRGMPWVGIRRDFAPPEQLLSELLIGTALHSHEVVPGFAVFLADGEPPPFRHILAIVDRSDGPISGLLAYAAVAVADTAGAKLDILVLGDAGENLHSEAELDILMIDREQELYDAAVERATAQDLDVTWITAAVKDPWEVVSAQLSQHDYDLVVEDLGDVSLTRVGLNHAVDGTLADGAAGEIPLKLLTETTLPILLVVDEIRLGLAPPTLLKAGAVVAVALGMVAAPIAAAAGVAKPRPTAGISSAAGELMADLESALGIAGQEEAQQQRAAEADRAARGSTDSGARAEAEQGDADGSPYVTQASAAVPTAATVPTGTEEASAASATRTQSEDKSSSEPKKPKKPKPPKGGATPSQVAKVEAKKDKAKAALEKDKKQKAKAKEAAAEAEEALAEVQSEGEAALATLAAATTTHEAATEQAAATEAAASGLMALLPGAPSEEEVAAALLAEQQAADALAEAVVAGEESLTTLAEAEQTLAEEQETLEKRAAEVKETKAEYAQTKVKAEVYRESLAETRQSPMAKGTYRLTARFGQTGGYWSSGVHTGVDFAGPTGTPILAAASGTVVSTGYEGAYGNQVIIDHGDGYETTYAHLAGINVSPGQKVSTGDQIGTRGSTGNSTGAHLHFEVLKNGKFIDPEGWLGW